MIYIPKRGSWLNIAEIKIDVKILQRFNRCIYSIDTLHKDIASWQVVRDQIQAKVDC